MGGISSVFSNKTDMIDAEYKFFVCKNSEQHRFTMKEFMLASSSRSARVIHCMSILLAESIDCDPDEFQFDKGGRVSALNHDTFSAFSRLLNEGNNDANCPLYKVQYSSDLLIQDVDDHGVFIQGPLKFQCVVMVNNEPWNEYQHLTSTELECNESQVTLDLYNLRVDLGIECTMDIKIESVSNSTRDNNDHDKENQDVHVIDIADV